MLNWSSSEVVSVSVEFNPMSQEQKVLCWGEPLSLLLFEVIQTGVEGVRFNFLYASVQMAALPRHTLVYDEEILHQLLNTDLVELSLASDLQILVRQL